MALKTNIVLGVSVCLFLGILVAADTRSPCVFPTMFNFGDSNSDTSLYVDNKPITGAGFPGKPKRFIADGRLIIDFIAEKLGKPWLASYLDLKRDLTYGANFAVGGSTIEIREPFNDKNLPNQTARFLQFKAETAGKNIDYSKALFTIDIGQNSVTRSMFGGTYKELPDRISVLAENIKKLYNEGARVFWIHNTEPQGCLLTYRNHPFFKNTPKNELGCLKEFNDVAMAFNKQLKDKVVELRAELKEATITYVDVYTPKYKLFSDGKYLGFPDPLASCQQNDKFCSDPDKYTLWDGIHFTEAANRFVAQSILDGQFSDPPVSITHACYKN